jgi:hypothetical protein
MSLKRLKLTVFFKKNVILLYKTLKIKAFFHYFAHEQRLGKHLSRGGKFFFFFKLYLDWDAGHGADHRDRNR